MSWFLIEMDEGQSKGGKINGRVVFGIIHSMDIIDNESKYMYLNRKVRFNWNHAILEGRVKVASDDRLFVEQHLKDLAKNNAIAMRNLNQSKRFLVQFIKGANTIVHTIVHEREVFWPADLENPHIEEVLVRDDEFRKMAKVLYVNDSDDLMQKELDALKAKCFDEVFIDPNDNIDIKETPWLLVQYSNSPSNICYTVVHLDKTIWDTQNQFPNIVTYLSLIKDTIFQAIILRKSRDRNELDAELRKIGSSSLSIQFPIATCFTTKVTLPPPANNNVLCAKPV
ncbi:early boundary activity protein 3 [Calliphora vicina]|uniref:early boundary activity protein 3 n=1 Tax=Calliphora vicina TaxID=7373 RepID=UPI00325BD297